MDLPSSTVPIAILKKLPMNKIIIPAVAAAATLACGISLHAQNFVEWSGGNGDFFNPTQWVGGAIPGVSDVAVINNGSTATIAADAGLRTLAGLQIGNVQDGTESGHVIMNGGTLVIGTTSEDPSQVLIGEGTVLSTFIQNGGTIMLDAPDTGLGNTSFKGVREIDWEVGLRGLGRFEMHNDAKFYASDDLKVAENAAGSGSVLMDGNSYVAVGSGVSISSGGENEQIMTMAGNSRLDSGNSMGAGSPLGGTDEGYLTLAIGGGRGTLIMQDNAIMNIRRLSAREGISTVTIGNNAQLHIFDVLNGAGTNAASRPAETGPNSTFGSAATSSGTFTLQDDAVMTVNSDPASGPTKGLGISAQRDAGNPGGQMKMVIRNRASLTIEQDLMLGTGADSTTSDGILEIVGPDATINIKGNLNMAVDLDGFIPTFDQIPGKSTLSAVITGPTHSAVQVGGTARITYGQLKVTLNGYSPALGTTYTLIDGGTIEGTFASTDFSGATLAQGLGWEVEYAADAVRLKVVEQAGLPGLPTANGLMTNSATLYVNTPDILNNGRTESIGVAIASNGNVIVGWEDDGDDDTQPNYVGAGWTLYNSSGTRITQPTLQNSTAFGGSITTPFLSYFRADGSAVPAYTSWGPKIKANFFGDGVGMGATSYQLGLEVPALAPIENNSFGENAGDYPTVQLLTSAGAAVGIVSGVSDAHAETDGNIRIGDWDFLASGNILVVGESRQGSDLVDKFGGSSPGNHVIYRIVTPTGSEVKGETLASESPEGPSEMWHGSGVTADGFALRFPLAGRAQIRMFDNAGNPTTGNIDLATLTGHEITSTGGRGDSIGFHGNGKDAYALMNIGIDEQGSNVVWVTVITTNSTVRYSKAVSTDVAITGLGRGDVAIDAEGRVLAVWDAQIPFDDGFGNITPVRIVMGRLLDPAGNPLGGTFYVSENEPPVETTLEARRPRVAMRDGVAAIVWESLNAGSEQRTVALRLFSTVTVGTGDVEVTVARNGNGLSLSWAGGNAPFTVQKKTALTDANWTTVTTTNERTAEVTIEGAHGFFRVASGANP